jgi:hypothetical protein
MKLVVAPFKNVLNKGMSRGEEIDGKCIQGATIVQGRGGLGGVDAMMKRDFKTIVNYYIRRVAKDGANMVPGKVQIEIKVSDEYFGKCDVVIIHAEIVE